MVRLAQRDRQPELMDNPGLDPQDHCRALSGLRRTNAWSGTTRVLSFGLRDLCRSSTAADPLRVLDVAAGGGDVLIRLARWAVRHGVNLEAHGCDISARAVNYATAAAERARAAGVTFSCLDALSDRLPTGYDVVLSTLFLHHLDEQNAERLLRRMAAAANRGVLIDDLVRSRRGYLLAWTGSRLLTRSRVVRVDGPLSVRSAFSISEARALADQAGLRGARIRQHWPQRFLLSWKKP